MSFARGSRISHSKGPGARGYTSSKGPAGRILKKKQRTCNIWPKNKPTNDICQGSIDILTEPIPTQPLRVGAISAPAWFCYVIVCYLIEWISFLISMVWKDIYKLIRVGLKLACAYNYRCSVHMLRRSVFWMFSSQGLHPHKYMLDQCHQSIHTREFS